MKTAAAKKYTVTVFWWKPGAIAGEPAGTDTAAADTLTQARIDAARFARDLQAAGWELRIVIHDKKGNVYKLRDLDSRQRILGHG